jgi:hypothetical protein
MKRIFISHDDVSTISFGGSQPHKMRPVSNSLSGVTIAIALFKGRGK